MPLSKTMTASDSCPVTTRNLVSIEEAYTQCPKALLRSELWNPERHIDRSELPKAGELLKSVAEPELDVDEYERERAGRYDRREGFY